MVDQYYKMRVLSVKLPVMWGGLLSGLLFMRSSIVENGASTPHFQKLGGITLPIEAKEGL